MASLGKHCRWPEAPEQVALVVSSQTTLGVGPKVLCAPSLGAGLPGGLCSSWEMSLSGSMSHSQAGNCRYLWALCGSPHLEVRNLPLQLLEYLTQMRSAGWFGLPKRPLVNAARRILNNNIFLPVVLIPPCIFFCQFLGQIPHSAAAALEQRSGCTIAEEGGICFPNPDLPSSLARFFPSSPHLPLGAHPR